MSKKSYLFPWALLILLLFHIAYTVYGFFKYADLFALFPNLEYYRFKFYDDVSISHFFVTALFWLILAIIIVKRPKIALTRKDYAISFLKIIVLSLLSCSFFMSYNVGLQIKLSQQLSEQQFNADKALLNVMAPFLYQRMPDNYSELFSVTQILYPKPFPVMRETNMVSYGTETYEESSFYSIDTLLVPKADLSEITFTKDTIASRYGVAPILDDITSFGQIKTDTIAVPYKGRKASLGYTYDHFTSYSTPIVAINGVDLVKQRYNAAKSRYYLLNRHPLDSMKSSFKKLDTLFTRYKIKTDLKPDDLATRIFNKEKNYKGTKFSLFSLDRELLIKRVDMFDRLLYQSYLLHHSIRWYFFIVVISLALVVFLISALIKKAI